LLQLLQSEVKELRERTRDLESRQRRTQAERDAARGRADQLAEQLGAACSCRGGRRLPPAPGGWAEKNSDEDSGKHSDNSLSQSEPGWLLDSAARYKVHDTLPVLFSMPSLSSVIILSTSSSPHPSHPSLDFPLLSTFLSPSVFFLLFSSSLSIFFSLSFPFLSLSFPLPFPFLSLPFPFLSLPFPFLSLPFLSLSLVPLPFFNLPIYPSSFPPPHSSPNNLSTY
jgi:hypothetical protein